tara:strand:- start:4741 stop:4959 length:219 start_codon:yes stop_codon:yes gene_type:complete
LLPTQGNLKGLEAQVHSSRLNLSTYIHVGKALIEENGYSLIEINNAACKPFKINLLELTSGSITADNFLHIE